MKEEMHPLTSSKQIGFTSVLWMLVNEINAQGSNRNINFISSVALLEDNLAGDIDDKYMEAVKKAEEDAEHVLRKKNGRETNPVTIQNNKAAIEWNLARLKYRELHKLMHRCGYKPIKDEIADFDESFEEEDDDSDA